MVGFMAEDLVERCENLHGLLVAEKPELIYHLNKDKEFLDKHLKDWAEGFREAYCGYACPRREECAVRERQY